MNGNCQEKDHTVRLEEMRLIIQRLDEASQVNAIRGTIRRLAWESSGFRMTGYNFMLDSDPRSGTELVTIPMYVKFRIDMKETDLVDGDSVIVFGSFKKRDKRFHVKSISNETRRTELKAL